MNIKRIATIGTTSIISLMIGGSGILKIIKAQPILDSFTKLGVAQYTQLLGVADLVFVALFLYPKTMKIGFVLLACYIAGAMGVHLSHGEAPTSPLPPMILLWVSAYLRDSSVFTTTNKSI
jgi:hypothetical protein